MLQDWRDTSTWNSKIEKFALRFQRKITYRYQSNASSVQYETKEWQTDTGYKYHTHHWKPTKKTEKTRTVILIPDWSKDARCFSDSSEIITGTEIANMGWNVISIDFCGRGNSMGSDDWGGFEHQEQLAQQLKQCGENVVVISFGASLNTTMRGVLLSECDIDYLIDVEGIPSKEILLRLPHGPKNQSKSEDYWEHRTCESVITDFPYPYHRLQGEIDQNLPDDLRHARLSIRNANKEHFRLNHHPMGIKPSRPKWLRYGRFGLQRSIIGILQTLQQS